MIWGFLLCVGFFCLGFGKPVHTADMKTTLTQELFSFLRADTVLIDLLGSDTSLRQGQAPEDIALPALVYNVQSQDARGTTLGTLHTDRVQLNVLGNATDESICRQILDRVRTLMDRASGGMIGDIWAYNIQPMHTPAETYQYTTGQLGLETKVVIHWRE